MALILIAGVTKYSEHALSAPAESAQHHAQHSHCTNLCRSVEHASHTVSVCIAPDVRHAAQTPRSLNLSLRVHCNYLLPTFF